MLAEEIRRGLLEAARSAQQRAYAPYSRFPVGAAVRTASGKVYAGANIENAAYPSSMCAERVAVFKAVAAGDRDLIALAVITPTGGFPCGACRQVLAEFGLDTVVVIGDDDGRVVAETTVGELLPGAFGPEHLIPGTA